MQATVLSECSAVMALDQGGRITYANDKLAAMLGYPATALVKMDLSALLPPLISQLHGTWFKVGVALWVCPKCPQMMHQLI